MNPERAAMNSIDRSRERRIELSPIMNRAYERAQAEVLQNPDYVIQEKDFEGVYHAAVQSDIAYADRFEKKFSEDRTEHYYTSKKISDTFEAIVLMQSEMNEWLGSNATTLRTARYDDIVNKVDMLAEWKSPTEASQFLALAVDISFGMKQIEKKLITIRHEIEKGELGTIRYFRDEAGNIMGTRRNVARTVVGISPMVIEELAGLWMGNKNKELGAHPMQRVMVDEMGFQLSMMMQYANKLGKFDVAQAYQQALNAMQTVRSEKKVIDIGDLAKDPVRMEIVEQTRSIFSTR
jgi:hypothetical protein